MIYEFCAENVTDLEKAMQTGARRVELVIIWRWVERRLAMVS